MAGPAFRKRSIRATTTGQDHRADILVRVRLAQGGVDRVDHRMVDRVDRAAVP